MTTRAGPKTRQRYAGSAEDKVLAWARSIRHRVAEREGASNQQDLMGEMKTNPQQNAGRAKMMVELTAYQTRHGVRQQNTRDLGPDVTGICFPIVRRPP
jgi:hypothetical protein